MKVRNILILIGLSTILPIYLLSASDNKPESLINAPAAQQKSSEALEFSTKIYNLGRFSVNSGAKSCSFTFKNISGKPIVINNILSSCGCTKPEWPKKPIMPNESGKIDVTYANDQGPYPIDKSITVYTSASTKPIILRITGVPYEADKSLKELFPVAIGSLGVVNNTFRLGQIEQGNSKSGKVTVANTSNKEVKVSFKNISKGLIITSNPTTIGVKGFAEFEYSVDTNIDKKWGNNKYSATVVCNGKEASTPVYIECMIIDNLSNLTKEQKNSGAMVIANNSSFNFGEQGMNKSVNGEFKLRNSGKSTLKIYKIDSNGSKITLNYPSEVAPGKEFTISASLVTGNKAGDEVHTLTLITNSPNRPLVNLFVMGSIK